MERSLWWRIREVKLTGGFGSSSRWHISVSRKIEEVRGGGSLFWGKSERHWISSHVEPGKPFDALHLKVPRCNRFQMEIWCK